MDNIFVERLWRSVKYEEVYLKDYVDVAALQRSLKRYFHFYNEERPHQSFNGATPHEIYDRGQQKKDSPLAGEAGLPVGNPANRVCEERVTRTTRR